MPFKTRYKVLVLSYIDTPPAWLSIGPVSTPFLRGTTLSISESLESSLPTLQYAFHAIAFLSFSLAVRSAGRHLPRMATTAMWRTKPVDTGTTKTAELRDQREHAAVVPAKADCRTLFRHRLIPPRSLRHPVKEES